MKIHELLSSPEKWTKKYFARDKEGNPTFVDSSNAVCWCLVGAITTCYTKDKHSTKVCNLISSKIFKSISEWNDAPERTYEDVINLCKELDI